MVLHSLVSSSTSFRCCAEAVDEAEAEVETKRKSLLKTSALLFDQAAPPQQVHDSEADGKVSSG